MEGDSIKLNGFSVNPLRFSLSHSKRVLALINIHLNSFNLSLEYFPSYTLLCVYYSTCTAIHVLSAKRTRVGSYWQHTAWQCCSFKDKILPYC